MIAVRLLAIDVSGERAIGALDAVARVGAPYAVEAVSGWDLALATAARREHDVVLVGPTVGPASGVDMIRALRTLAPAMPLLLVTVEEPGAIEIEALAAGARDVLVLSPAVPPAEAARWLRSAVEGARVSGEVERLRDELAREREEIETLARAVSHDLRGPLQVISGWVELLAIRFRPQADPRTHHAIDRVLHGVAQANDRIHALLSLARLDGLDAPVTLVDLDRAWDAAVGELTVERAEGRLAASREALPTLPGREALYTWLLRHLITTWLGTHGAGTVHVRASAQSVPGGWRISVSANRRVERRLIRRLFQPFGDGTDTTHLAACKKIVERHHGRIAYEDRENGGAFWFQLPGR